MDSGRPHGPERRLDELGEERRLREGERRARPHDAPERRHGRQEQHERDGDAERAEDHRQLHLLPQTPARETKTARGRRIKFREPLEFSPRILGEFGEIHSEVRRGRTRVPGTPGTAVITGYSTTRSATVLREIYFTIAWESRVRAGDRGSGERVWQPFR